MGKKKPTSALRLCRKRVSKVRNTEHASWYAVGIEGAALVTTASHRYSLVASMNRGDVRNTGPAFSRRIFRSSSDSVLPRTTATFCRSPGFFASLQRARKTRNASVARASLSLLFTLLLDVTGVGSNVSAPASPPAPITASVPDATAVSVATDPAAAATPAAASNAGGSVLSPPPSLCSELAPPCSPSVLPLRPAPSTVGVTPPVVCATVSSLSNSASVTSCFAHPGGTSTMPSPPVSAPAAAAMVVSVDTALMSEITLLTNCCTNCTTCTTVSSSLACAPGRSRSATTMVGAGASAESASSR
mmetsp:Transcript_21443/g.52983  ORF Transcript_21443/g.52983 Transcript_21443/m.52983 type:complete len:303 (+) Transcript_21443:1954-2862(+)